MAFIVEAGRLVLDRKIEDRKMKDRSSCLAFFLSSQELYAVFGVVSIRC